jgi:chromosome partitioning protein
LMQSVVLWSCAAAARTTNYEPNKLMAKIFAIANQKGGVGKTTTTVNLAAALAATGQRVLLVDLDPQGNATMGSGVDKRTLATSVYQVLLGLATVSSTRQRSTSGSYDVLPANRELAGAEIELVELSARETRLKVALAIHLDEYDFVLIDCPPALSLLTLNGLCAAHGVIIPMQCEYYALEGLSDLVNTIKQVHRNLNGDLEIIGLLRVMFDPRSTLAQQVSAQLEAHFKDKVFSTVVPRNVRLAEAPSYGVPGVIFDRSSKGAQAYLAFAAEMIERFKRSATEPARPLGALPENRS